MRISDWINRLSGDIAHNRQLLFLCVVIAWTLLSFIAVGMYVVVMRAQAYWHHRRSRCTCRAPDSSG